MDSRVTRVRYDAATGQSLLQAYIFGDGYGPSRVPRGILPEVVFQFVERFVVPEKPAAAYGKCLEALRFYELPEALPGLSRGLERLEDEEDLRRSATVLQAIGDLGGSSEVDRAASTFDSRLVPHRAAPREFEMLLATRLALTPHGSDKILGRRIRDEVEQAKTHERENEQAMMHFDRLAAVERNDLPRTRAMSEAKVRLSGRPALVPDLKGLVDTYLGRSAAAGPYLEIWSARMLRRAAFAQGLNPIVQEFGRVIDAANPKQQGTLADFAVVRSAQAIIYLGGTLLSGWAETYRQSLPTGGAMNFLWDDP
jgi:hypothetical protein